MVNTTYIKNMKVCNEKVMQVHECGPPLVWQSNLMLTGALRTADEMQYLHFTEEIK